MGKVYTFIIVFLIYVHVVSCMYVYFYCWYRYK